MSIGDWSSGVCSSDHGYYTRNIPGSVSVIYPNGWQAATALRPASTSGSTVTYKTIDYDTLVVSPNFAGKYFKAVELSPKVTLNIVADEARYLNFTTEQIAAHKNMFRQTRTLIQTANIDHYDLLQILNHEPGTFGRDDNQNDK